MINERKAVGLLASTVLAGLSWSSPAQSQALKTPYPAMAPVEQYRIANREDEVRLARSAAPASISGDAQVLVLGSHGYETAVKGKNGYLMRTEWVLAGATREQIIERTKAAVARGSFKPPEAGAFSFMLSKDGYLSDDGAGPWLPHVMFFLPHGQVDDWAASKEGSPIIGQDGSAIETTVLFIPVRRWSDGSPAPPPAEKHVM
jgi:hypothetical protein